MNCAYSVLGNVQNIQCIVRNTTIFIENKSIIVGNKTNLIEKITILVGHITILVEKITIIIRHITNLVENKTLIIRNIIIIVCNRIIWAKKRPSLNRLALRKGFNNHFREVIAVRCKIYLREVSSSRV